MQYDLQAAKAVLSRTPHTLSILLRDLPEPWIRQNEGPDTWCVFDVVGHLIHGDQNDWITRARIIIEHGTSRPFDPYDRFAQLESNKDKDLGALLNEFASARRQSLMTLDGLGITPEKLKLQGMHPKLGVVTLGQLLSTWVVHDLDHIMQISRVMAKGYAEEVGPWSQYLRILKAL
jgi:hypothetical protein